MNPPFFSDVFKDTNDLLSKDFYHLTPLSLDIKTVARNGVNFNINARQPVKDGPLSTNFESKYIDKSTGIALTQTWSNRNKLNSKIEINDITPGLKTELSSFFNPNLFLGKDVAADKDKNVNLNVNFIQHFFTARGNFNFLNGPPNFTGDFTLYRDGFVYGSQLKYNINQGSISDYAMAVAYKTLDYSIGLQVDDKQLTSLSFNQILNPNLQIGSRAILDPKFNSNKVNLEFVTKYLIDVNSQIKLKVSDSGSVAMGYKQALRPGVTLGLGASFDALNLNEPVHKLGWSLSFDA
ncbi:hypothetical protein KAFR_0J01130 [Kazachstania africana CBS 2517]|uniref:Mitochondrial outer membrane protein porin n=1 Tax=Kazachstania africana (strain ATCC 22294 / BCRC 22015 / CBS 2517 / CECT 1963 / NBRC 1671 / NRRL Y-8276) TaxID=1071382 RepID=H2B0N0_KAZAF|nr:hypothetical protein KAFR_0J01130 [Kazachstania africana CBS 2517]CCF60180.1 hypothetical protein KAFR_0J01130 [Kazachstania africana CBS 2517]